MKLKLKKSNILVKLLSTVFLVCVGAILLFLALFFYSEKTNPPASNITYGVSFSPQHVTYLGLDWKQTYTEILEDLNLKALRLSSYWTTIEKNEGIYDFSEDDFLLEEAKGANAKVILVVGIKQPRWPECHLPDWARKLSKEDRQQKALEFIQKVVDRYKGNSAIWAWQVENEPFFYPYGKDCYLPDQKFLEKEIALVRSLDKRPIIISETGELALWTNQMQLSDVFGTTLYRTVYNGITGYTNYPVTPGYYSLRSNLYRKFLAPKNQKTIIVELQAEPWLISNSPTEIPLEEQMNIFSIDKMKETIDFASRTSFDEIYLWGVEWWYFMKQKGQPQYWEYAKELMNN